MGPTIAGGMGSPDGDLAHERAAVERARGGDHRAFVELYRQDAPPAWRLAVALTGDPRRAEDAVAEGFRRTLAPLRAALPRSEVAFRVRLLAATRHAVLDGAAAPPTATAPLSSAAAAEGTRSTGKGRAAEAMAAFAAPPEGWRTILWLVVVEGLGTLDAARVLDPTPVEAEALTERAQAGLRAQWRRDREADGTAAPVFPAHLDRELQPVLPSPSGSSTPSSAVGTAPAVTTPGRWASRCRAVGPCPGGPNGRWSAPRPRWSPSASPAPWLSTATRPPAPRRTWPPTPTAVAGAEAAAVQAQAAGESTAGTPMASGDDEGGEDPPAPPKPLLDLNVGTGDELGVRTGSRCTGVELAGAVVGCEPATRPNGLTADVESSLLPGL